MPHHPPEGHRDHRAGPRRPATVRFGQWRHFVLVAVLLTVTGLVFAAFALAFLPLAGACSGPGQDCWLGWAALLTASSGVLAALTGLATAAITRARARRHGQPPPNLPQTACKAAGLAFLPLILVSIGFLADTTDPDNDPTFRRPSTTMPAPSWSR